MKYKFIFTTHKYKNKYIFVFLLMMYQSSWLEQISFQWINLVWTFLEIHLNIWKD